jgi:hypothetical protein
LPALLKQETIAATHRNVAALRDAKNRYGENFKTIVDDLSARFADYEKTVKNGDISRGRRRLDDVLAAIDTPPAGDKNGQ